VSHDIQRTAIARSIASRLPFGSLDEVRVLDVVLGTLEHIRNAGEWERREAGDDRSWHTVRHLRATAAGACGETWPIASPVEQSANPPLHERCTACWRAAAASSPGGPALGEALLVVIAEMAERDRERAGLREAARAEMLGEHPADRTLGEQLAAFDDELARTRREHRRELERMESVSIGRPGDDMSEPLAVAPGGGLDPAREFAADQHLTVVRSDSEVIALGEGRVRDEAREVELEWDVSDVEEPLGVHVPDYDFEGG